MAHRTSRASTQRGYEHHREKLATGLSTSDLIRVDYHVLEVILTMVDKQTATHVAILAPVPQCHLDTAPMGGPKVAFATMAWELFKKDLPKSCGNQELPIDVFIYASGPKARYGPVVSYRATYVQLIEDKHTVQQTGYRPPSTKDDTDDFCVFWVVEDLHQVDEKARIPVSQFRPYQKDSSSADKPHKSKLHKDKTYEENFIPRGPLLVEHPHLMLP